MRVFNVCLRSQFIFTAVNPIFSIKLSDVQAGIIGNNTLLRVIKPHYRIWIINDKINIKYCIYIRSHSLRLNSTASYFCSLPGINNDNVPRLKLIIFS